MRLVIVTIILFLISAVAIPYTWSITEPMFREITMKSPGEPDFTYPRSIGKIGMIVAVASFVLALGFSIVSIIKLPPRYRPLALLAASLIIVGIPYVVVMQGEPYSSAGDGGPNFFPLLVIAGGGLVASPFLLWFFASLFFLKSKPKRINTGEQDAPSNR